MYAPSLNARHGASKVELALEHDYRMKRVKSNSIFDSG
jgi:hypothetical protein